MAGRGMPEASQLRATGFFTTTLTFSGTFTWPIILGGTKEGGNEGMGQRENLRPWYGLQLSKRNSSKQSIIHTIYTDVMLAVSLSRHINSYTGVASCVWHLSIFNLQQPPLVQDLGTMLAGDRPPVFQPCDSWSWHALCSTLEGYITSFCDSNVITVAPAVFDGRTDWSEKSKWVGAHATSRGC